MLFILADTFETAKNYTIDTGVNEWRFIFGPLTLKGHQRPIKYVKIGKWWQRSDKTEIEDLLKALGAQEVPI